MEDYTMFVSRSEVILQSHSMADPTKTSHAEEMKGMVRMGTYISGRCWS